MDSIKEIINDILEPKSSLRYKSIGVAMATVFYFFVGLIMTPYPCCIKNANARKQGVAILNSLVLSAAYIYSWKLGNPHDAEAYDNSPSNEVPLMLTAGYYVLDSLSFKSCIDTLHHILSLSAILEVLVEGRAANVAVTFAFMVEVATLLYNMRKVAIQLQSPCIRFLNIMYPAVFIAVRIIFLLHFCFNIVDNKDLPEIPKALAIILFMMSFFYCFRMFQQVFGEPEEPRFTRRSRSRTPRVSRTSRNSRSRCGLITNIDSFLQ